LQFLGASLASIRGWVAVRVTVPDDFEHRHLTTIGRARILAAPFR